MINSAAKQKRILNYNRYFIGLTDGAVSGNFVYFTPRKSFMRICADLSPVEPWEKHLEASGLDFETRDDEVVINATPQAFTENKALMNELLQEAVRQDEA